MDQGKYEEASQSFAYAARAKNTPGLRYYVGFCLEQAGGLVEALAEYQLAAQLLEKEAAPDVERLVPLAIERVSGALAFVSFSDLPEGSKLILDGEVIDWTEKLPLVPGEHEVRVEHPDYEAFARSISLSAGQTELLRIALVKKAAQPEAPALGPSSAAPEDAGSGASAQKIVFWSSLGVGAVGLGVGTVGAILFATSSKREKELGDDVDGATGGGSAGCIDPPAGAEEACNNLKKAASRHDVGGSLMIG
jgi:hypothetical protein